MENCARVNIHIYIHIILAGYWTSIAMMQSCDCFNDASESSRIIERIIHLISLSPGTRAFPRNEIRLSEDPSELRNVRSQAAGFKHCFDADTDK